MAQSGHLSLPFMAIIAIVWLLLLPLLIASVAIMIAINGPLSLALMAIYYSLMIGQSGQNVLASMAIISSH